VSTGKFSNNILLNQLQLNNFICSQCGFRFVSQDTLDNHKQNKHEGDGGEERPFSCDICSASFKTHNHLQSHIKIIHSTEEKKFVCVICNKRYAFNYLLTTHMNSHTDVKKFTCSVCQSKFKSLCHMKHHYQRAHGEFTYPCTECPIKMKTLNELRKHLQAKHGKSMNIQKYH